MHLLKKYCNKFHKSRPFLNVNFSNFPTFYYVGLKKEKKIIHCSIPISFSYMDQLMLVFFGLTLIVLWLIVFLLQPT